MMKSVKDLVQSRKISGGSLVAAFSMALVLKIALVLSGRIPFNSDEAVVALMARHILQGARPIFFYGQAYMGSLDAWLVAALFYVFGESVAGIRWIQTGLYLGTLLTTGWMACLIFQEQPGTGRRVGLAAIWCMAVPTVNVTLYTTASLGGYGEALCLGNGILVCGFYLVQAVELKQTGRVTGLCLLLGFLSGLGLWAFGLTLVYTFPVYGYIAWKMIRLRLAFRQAGLILFLLGLGALMGALPLLMFAGQQRSLLFVTELSGSAIAGTETGSGLMRLGQHGVSLLLLGGTVILGMRPPWEVRWLGLPLLPVVMLFWGAVLVYWVRRWQRQALPPRLWPLLGVMATLLLAFLLTPFGADPSGRYFVPLAVPMAILAGGLIAELVSRWGWRAWGLLWLVVGFHLWGTLDCARQYPPGLTTQFDAVAQIDHEWDAELIAFLHQQDERYGYTNYWVAYPLAFLSQETLIYVPRLPYHEDFRFTLRDDRYLPYDRRVAQAQRAAYITTHHPDLDERLRLGFKHLGVSWQEAQIGDFQVFYRLSRKVFPEELGLGEDWP